ncbi:MAG: CBS domain-containing protein [Nitrospira sp.]|nr:CBS domain-containing protein [Nitrospira sp.]
MRARSSVYLESTTDEQLGLLPGEARNVKHAMSSAVTVASPQTSLKEAASLMTALNVPVIVVYDGTRLVGMITDRDMGLNHQVRQAPEEAAIDGLMRKHVPRCSEDDLLADALSVMRASGIDWLPVVDSRERLVGVLSAHVAPTRKTRHL